MTYFWWIVCQKQLLSKKYWSQWHAPSAPTDKRGKNVGCVYYTKYFFRFWMASISRYFVIRFLDHFLFWGLSMPWLAVLMFLFCLSMMNVFFVMIWIDVLILFAIVVRALFSSWVSVGVLVRVCCSFVVLDRVSGFLLVGHPFLEIQDLLVLWKVNFTRIYSSL